MTLPRCPIFHLDKLMFFDAVTVGGMKLTQFEKIFPYTVFLMVKPSMLFFMRQSGLSQILTLFQ